MKRLFRQLQKVDPFAILLIMVAGAWLEFNQPAQAPRQNEPNDQALANDSNTKAKESFWVRTIDDPVSTFTAILVIFNSVLAFVSIVQIKYLHRADQSSEAASKIAKLTADAANESAAVARTTLENTVRAFVDFSSFDAHHCADQRGMLTHFSFYVNITNNGQTATRRAKVSCSWVFTKQPIGSDYIFPDIIRTEIGSSIQNISLGAKHIKTGPRANIPIEFVTNAYERSGHLYMWGWIDYDDVLPNTPRRRSEFAGEITVARNPVTLTPADMPIGQHFGLRNLDTHNGADDECRYQPGDERPNFLAHNGPRPELPPNHPENQAKASGT